MDNGANDTSQDDLTSTMENVLSTTKDNNKKQEDNVAVNSSTSDAIPSSSSDANIIQISNDTGLDDPISSTSDSLFDAFKTITDTDAKSSTLDSDVDMFANDFNISDVRSEKITEDVEDIVNELENLLEEGSNLLTKSSSSHYLTTSTNTTRQDDSTSNNNTRFEVTKSESEVKQKVDDSNNFIKNVDKSPESTVKAEMEVSNLSNKSQVDKIDASSSHDAEVVADKSEIMKDIPKKEEEKENSVLESMTIDSQEESSKNADSKGIVEDILECHLESTEITNSEKVITNDNESIQENVGALQENAEVIQENVEALQENAEVIQENVELLQENAEVFRENVETLQENDITESATSSRKPEAKVILDESMGTSETAAVIESSDFKNQETLKINNEAAGEGLTFQEAQITTEDDIVESTESKPDKETEDIESNTNVEENISDNTPQSEETANTTNIDIHYKTDQILENEVTSKHNEEGTIASEGTVSTEGTITTESTITTEGTIASEESTESLQKHFETIEKLDQPVETQTDDIVLEPAEMESKTEISSEEITNNVTQEVKPISDLIQESVTFSTVENPSACLAEDVPISNNKIEDNVCSVAKPMEIDTIQHISSEADAKGEEETDETVPVNHVNTTNVDNVDDSEVQKIISAENVSETVIDNASATNVLDTEQIVEENTDCTPADHGEQIELDITDNIVLINKVEEENISVNIDSLDNIVMDSSSLMDLEAAAAVAAINAEKSNLFEEFVDEEINSSSNCQDIFPSATESSSFTVGDIQVPEIKSENNQNNLKDVPDVDAIEIEAVTLNSRAVEVATHKDDIVLEKACSSILDNVTGNEENSDQLVDDDVVKVDTVEDNDKEDTIEASVKAIDVIKKGANQIETAKAPVEIIQSASVDSNLTETPTDCANLRIEQSGTSQNSEILPPEAASSSSNNEINAIISTPESSNVIKDSFKIDTNEISQVSHIETKTSKLVVELSLADTTATSDCDIQSESEKETEKKSRKNIGGNFKRNRPETELNKVLTIEVDDVQSENYETSNDETLECSSRSDLEDGKPEYSSRISKSEDLKMTIIKQKPEECHSILKIYNPDDPKDSIPKFRIKSNQQEGTSNMETVPKITLKSLLSPDNQTKRLHKLSSPKTSDLASSKLTVFSPNSQRNRKADVISPIKLTIKPVKTEENQQRSSPKITIKPITKPETDEAPSSKGSPKITIKPIIKPDEIEIQKITKAKLRSDDESESTKANPKITIKPIPKPDHERDEETDCSSITLKQLLKSGIDDTIEVQRVSPKVIIKAVVKTDEDLSSTKFTSKTFANYEQSQCSPKITIKPIHKPDDDEDNLRHSPKITIKPITRSDDDISYEISQCSPKITIKPIVRGDNDEIEDSRGSPKITIKPIIKPDEEIETVYSPKITIKPIIKPDDEHIEESSRASPKLIIKQINKNDDIPQDTRQHSPKITIKPIPPKSEVELLNSPRITIKPITKPDDLDYLDNITHSPKITIKPIHKPSETADLPQSPRITIKPIVKYADDDLEENIKIEQGATDYEEEIKQERIVLKIQKNTIPTPTSSRKREFVDEDEKSERLGKIKLKFSKEGGHAEIVSAKRQLDMDTEIIEVKRIKSEEIRKKEEDDVVEIIQIMQDEKVDDKLQAANDVTASANIEDPLDKIPVFDITQESTTPLKKIEEITPVTSTPIVPTPRKRGRPRKVPLEVREEFKDENTPVIEESTRPKRSCRGPSVRTTLGIKPRKPRGPGRGRGGKRGMGTGRVGRPPGRPKLSATKLKLLKETVGKTDGDDIKETKSKLSDVVMIEEETRMSADTNCSSRAQTPAKQIQVGIAPDIEESQSSVQSSATTESIKGRRAPRLEVHPEPEGSVISADQLAEYYWGGGGPYMLQEQVAQFLGIKSFKRKYPGIKRRPVEMQERDFIREQGLASEAMCDLGLTAVNSSDILDILYTDFQNKYEEYCKHQRDRQVKDFSNKQKALSLQVSQEKNTLAQQAVQSAAAWNSQFNKTRREERKACIDLQTFTVHYPKGKLKQINKPKTGNYPLALVPGQFTDYYKQYTPAELNNLPLNTICYDPLAAHHDNDDSQSDCSGSDSDSSSTDSYSSSSDSTEDECNMCTPPTTPKNILAH